MVPDCFRGQYGWLALVWGLAVVLLEIQSCRSAEWENLAKEVAYTGLQSCQPCHSDIFASYQRTGMGRSWYRPDPSDRFEDFGPTAYVYDPLSDFYYRPFWLADSLYIEEYRLQGTDTIHYRRERIDYIVGSGHQTRSYVLERNGFLYEAPITWYVARRIWDLSPGYHDGHNSRFDRPIGIECVHCHNAYTEPVRGTLNRYRQIPLGIDCERCHGPGSLHVERMLRGEEVDVGKQPDYSIVNPSKLSLDLQFDVCQQCHLQGVNVIRDSREFRPGRRLSDLREVFLIPSPDTNSFGIASHAARLRQSACFLRSKGKLTCTNCHNPHVSIHELSADRHQQSCKSCHGNSHVDCSQDKAIRAAQLNDCIFCHMPKGGTSDIPHVQFTDHYIRKPSPQRSVPKVSAGSPSIQAYVELICATSTDPEDHTRGKAWLAYYEQHEARRVYLERALELLPDSCFEARSRVLLHLGRADQALPLAQKAHEQEPQNTLRAFQYAQVLETVGQFDRALVYYLNLFSRNKSLVEAANRAVALLIKTRPGQIQALYEAERILLEAIREQPHRAEAFANLGFVYLNLRRYANAQTQLRKALTLNPDSPIAIENMQLLQRRLGRVDSAEWYARRIQSLNARHKRPAV